MTVGEVGFQVIPSLRTYTLRLFPPPSRWFRCKIAYPLTPCYRRYYPVLSQSCKNVRYSKYRSCWCNTDRESNGMNHSTTMRTRDIFNNHCLFKKRKMSCEYLSTRPHNCYIRLPLSFFLICIPVPSRV